MGQTPWIISLTLRRRVTPDTGKRAVQPKGKVARKPRQQVTSQSKSAK